MGIKFFNIRSGERREVDTEPMIAAFFNSTDQHVNALVGQDMGWRLDAETIKRMRDIKGNQSTMDRIAAAFSLPMDGVSDTDVLRWISLEDAREKAKETENVQGDYSKQYEEEIRALDKEPSKPEKSIPEPAPRPQKAEEEKAPATAHNVTDKQKSDSNK